MTNDEFAARFTQLVSIIFKENEALERSARRLSLQRDHIVNEATARLPQLRTAVTSELEALDLAEAQLEAATSRKVTFVPRFKRLTSAANVIIQILVAIGAISFLASFLTTFFHPGLPIDQAILRQGIPIAAFGFSIVIFLLRRLALRENKRARVDVDTFNNALKIDVLTAQRDSSLQSLDRALIDRALLPLVLELHDEQDDVPFSTQLSFVTARGLSQVYDADMFEVETSSVRKVRDFLDRTPGGSLGLAGPRGTGKTTVMSSFVEGRSRRSDGARGRAVRVSAPVEYVARDFILHLFSELCQSVLVPSTTPQPPRYASTLSEFRGRRWEDGLRAGLLISALMAALGVMLIFIGLRGIDINERLSWGMLLVLASISLAFGLTRGLRQVRSRWEFDKMQERNREMDREYSQLQGREGVSEGVATLAADYLETIRFQQTYTSGWSGSLKVGISVVEASGQVNAAASKARYALSLPEISQMFNAFALSLAGRGPVIIGIDELDKIEDPDRAQAFLNDIKSVFGLGGCYFLISISEDALANFERRGLPIRDAFDSALDDVVHFGALSYETTLRLVRGRLVGVPEPYAGLVYCLGGGLPRDVIRWTRALVEAHEATDKDDLTSLAAAVIHVDVQKKLSATIAFLERDPSASSRLAVRELSALELRPSSDSLLKLYAAHVKRPEPGQALAQPAQTRGDVHVSPSETALDAFFTYLYFCATILDTFRTSMSEGEFHLLVGQRKAGTLDDLVRARNLFVIDPWLAARSIEKFRRQALPPSRAHR